MELGRAAGFLDTAGAGGTTPSEREKKSKMWLGGMLDCMSTIFSIFRKTEYQNVDGDPFMIKSDKLFNIGGFLGAGSQGMVYTAMLQRTPKDTEMVAVKYVNAIDDMTMNHLRKIKHQNLVQVLGVVVNEPETHLVVMEYCQYGSLYDFLHGGHHLTPRQMVNWARGIATGMQHLHNLQIIHRDLKSPNVLISDSFIAKVSDFGTSRRITDKSAVMSFAGTLNWMAPEVIRHESYSEKIDVWSFGVVLWELVTKQIPYFQMEQHAIMWAVGTDLISLPIPSTVPGGIQVLLIQCWNRTHKLRPSFRVVMRSIELIAHELMMFDQVTFNKKQDVWACEALEAMDRAFKKSRDDSVTLAPEPPARHDLQLQRRRAVVQLDRANEIYMEVCSVRLQLEQRERELAQKEKFVEKCRCGARRGLKWTRQASSSSEGAPAPARMLVSFDNDKVSTAAVGAACVCGAAALPAGPALPPLPPPPAAKKDTVVELNGHVVAGRRYKRAQPAAEV